MDVPSDAKRGNVLHVISGMFPVDAEVGRLLDVLIEHVLLCQWSNPFLDSADFWRWVESHFTLVPNRVLK
jgi:hypothetical protein